MKYELPALPYEYNALEPYIDARTMEIHYTKHHATYVNNLNKALDGVGILAPMTLEQIISDLSVVPQEIREVVRNNGGGHLNHSFFWPIMSPSGGGEPVGDLRETINSTFGDFRGLRAELTKAALGRFGSGWAWLAIAPNETLEVLSTPNQDSPLMTGHIPIIGVDVWEHAYYLKYQNRRADYLEAWWNTVNWEKAGEIYLAHRALLASAG